MKKYDLMKSGEKMIRVLEVQEDKVLIIDCIRKTMPVWVDKILRELCERKGIEIVEAQCCPDHVHMLVRIPPKYSVSEIMGYLKGKSSLIIFDRHVNLKYKYGNRPFWCRGYYVDTAGKNAKKIS